MEVTKVLPEAEWEEKHRGRSWVSPEKAAKVLKQRELAPMVEQAGGTIDREQLKARRCNSMPRLIAALIRHGDYHQLARTPSAHQPFALNLAGREQARAGAGMLARSYQTKRMDTAEQHRLLTNAAGLADSANHRRLPAG